MLPNARPERFPDFNICTHLMTRKHAPPDHTCWNQNLQVKQKRCLVAFIVMVLHYQTRPPRVLPGILVTLIYYFK